MIKELFADFLNLNCLHFLTRLVMEATTKMPGISVLKNRDEENDKDFTKVK